MSSTQQHDAAVTIQQRFWYCKARWVTRSRLTCKILRHGLNYNRMRQTLIPIEQFIKLAVEGHLSAAFSTWLKRIIHISIRETDVLCADLESIVMNKPDNAVNRVLSAFLFALYKDTAIDLGLPFAHMLYLSSLELCSAIDSCMNCLSNTIRDKGKVAIDKLRIFLEIHGKWRQNNESIIVRRLAHGAIEKMHNILSLRMPAMVNQGAMATAPLEDPRLITMKLISNHVCPFKSILLDSSAVRMMHQMAESEFWGTQGLHASWFVHELMIDKQFRLTVDQTIPNLSAKYSRKRTWNAKELIFDAGTVIMWECKKAEDIVELAEAVDVDMFPSLLQNIPATVERIRSIVCRLVPGIIAAELRTCPPSEDDRESLRCLLQYALILRNSVANMDISIIRHRQPSFMTNYVYPIGIKTHQWIHAAVLRNGPVIIENLLARGDPFALLKLHDHAIMDLMLLLNTGAALDTASLPEILYYDANRLQYVSSTLNAYTERGFKSQREFNSAFRELVNSGAGKHKFPPQVADAASKLRTVIFVCRHRHGNNVAKIAHEIAKSVASTYVRPR